MGGANCKGLYHYLDYAELQAQRHIPMSMEDWAKRLEGFAETEYEKYRIIQDRLYQSDFNRFVALEDEIKKVEE